MNLLEIGAYATAALALFALGQKLVGLITACQQLLQRIDRLTEQSLAFEERLCSLEIYLPELTDSLVAIQCALKELVTHVYV